MDQELISLVFLACEGTVAVNYGACATIAIPTWFNSIANCELYVDTILQVRATALGQAVYEHVCFTWNTLTNNLVDGENL